MIYYWLTLSFPLLLGILTLAFASIAVLLVLLSFVFRTSPTIRSFKGVVAPFVGTVAVIFAILLGFLASDIWDRERRAAAAVRTEAESLLSLATLAKTFDLPREPLAGAMRGYIGAVVNDEWPRMADGQSADLAEQGLDQLLKIIARLDVPNGPGNADIHRLLFDGGMAVRAARNERLHLAGDSSENLKWKLVLVMAVMCQVTVAVVHLELIRPQIAALTIWTVSLIAVIGLLAAYELPFTPPFSIAPTPIANVLRLVAPQPAAAAQP